jgi:hypothetical protein
MLFKPRSELTDLRHRRDALSAQQLAGERRLREATDARRLALIDGDDPDVPAKSSVLVARLTDELVAVRDAISALDDRIREAEVRAAAARDKAQREEEVALRTQQITQARAALDEFTTATEQLTAALQTLAPINLITSSASGSVKIFGGQLSAAVVGALLECQGYVARVGAGNVPIIGSPQPVAATPPPVLDIPRVEVMLHQASRWREGDQTCTGPKFGLVRLPTTLANEACTRHLAVRTDDPHYHKLRASEAEPYGMSWARPPVSATVVDLSNPDAPPTPESSRAGEWTGPSLAGTATLSPARW